MSSQRLRKAASAALQLELPFKRHLAPQ